MVQVHSFRHQIRRIEDLRVVFEGHSKSRQSDAKVIRHGGEFSARSLIIIYRFIYSASGGALHRVSAALRRVVARAQSETLFGHAANGPCCCAGDH